MTSLAEIADRDFDVVAPLDDALPHLTADQLSREVGALGSRLKSNGLFIASIRDYDTLILERLTTQEPAFYGGMGDRRIVHQVWDWIDDTRYALHLYITMQSDQLWKTHHVVSEYRCHIYAEATSSTRHWASRDTTSSGTRIVSDLSHDACSSRPLLSLSPVFAASV